MSIKGEVVKGQLDAGSFMVSAGCHHTKGSTTACGGCYARLSHAIDDALEALEVDGDRNKAIATLKATITQRRAEKL